MSTSRSSTTSPSCAIAERITALHLGRIIAEGGIAAIENHPKVKEAYLGSGAIH